jgi:multidrug resistance efflux pump
MARLPDVRSIISARGVRVAVALLLMGVGIWAFAPYVAYRVSSSAFVNSEISRVRAPIEGYLSSELPRKGKFIDHASTLTLIKSDAADRRRLLDLEGQQAAAKDRSELAQKQLADIAQLDRQLEQRMQAYRGGLVERLGLEIKEAEAERTGCLAEVLQRRDIGTRMQGLAKSGTTSHIRSAEALAKQEATAALCQMAAARVERLKAESISLRKGVYLRDASNDVPYSQQQRERLFLRRQELETEAHRESARALQLTADIAEERARVERLTQYNFSLPPDHVVWSVPASPGSAVTQGQTVIDFADCDHRFVAVELPEREFETIKPGDAASVRLIGSDIWRQGTIRQVRGSAAHEDDRLLAAQVPTPTRGNVTVEVSLPRESAKTASSNFCDIGRLADVRFHREAPAVMETASLLFWSFVDLFRPVEKLASQ